MMKTSGAQSRWCPLLRLFFSAKTSWLSLLLIFCLPHTHFYTRSFGLVVCIHTMLLVAVCAVKRLAELKAHGNPAC